MKHIILGIIAALLIIGAGAYVLGSSTNSTTTQTASVATGTSSNNTSTGTGTTGSSAATATNSGAYTLAQVATHGSQASCWTAINGKVYDVTTWISQHPGGQQAILSLCGKDGSAAFNGQHGGQARPASELATFLIGTLAQ